MKSIEKLRESSHLDDDKWTLETGEVVHVFNSKPDDPNAVNWGEQWRNIADEIEAEIAENYMELPKDADGVPVHVDDRITLPRGEETTVQFVAPDCVLPVSPVSYYMAVGCRHVKPDPLKALLSDLANEVWNASCTCQTTWSDSGLDGIEELYAKRVRELMEEGGE